MARLKRSVGHASHVSPIAWRPTHSARLHSGRVNGSTIHSRCSYDAFRWLLVNNCFMVCRPKRWTSNSCLTAQDEWVKMPYWRQSYCDRYVVTMQDRYAQDMNSILKGVCTASRGIGSPSRARCVPHAVRHLNMSESTLDSRRELGTRWWPINLFHVASHGRGLRMRTPE